jgi:hypothetical protein
VYVRYNRTQSLQVDVRSAVPRTAPTTRNWIIVGRIDEASNREYIPQKHDRPHTRASVALWMMISEACSPSLCSQKAGQECAKCNMSERLFACNQKNQHLHRIYTQTEGGEQTLTNGHHDGHCSRQNAQPLGRNIRTKVLYLLVAVLHPFSQLLNKCTNGPPISIDWFIPSTSIMVLKY